MKIKILIILLLPALLSAQEFTFRQEFDTIPVEINGWQTFAPWVGGFSVSNPELIDIDADFDLDFFVGDQSGDITFLVNSGSTLLPEFDFVTRSFAGVNLSGTLYAGYSTPVMCDIDGDNDYDLFTSCARGLVHFWENQGDSASPCFVWITDSLGYIDVPGPAQLDFVDIDNDNDFDLFIGDNIGQIHYYRNEGNSQVLDFVLITTQFCLIDVGDKANPCFIDIDNDNDFDLFIGDEDGRIWHYENTGTPDSCDFEYRTDAYNGIDVGDKASPEFADIDGDGDYDLFVGRDQLINVYNETGDIWYFENIGSPDSAQWIHVTTNYLSLDAGDHAKLNTADINADIDNDIFIGISGNTLAYYENVGTGLEAAFSWISDNYQEISVNGGSHTFCDINADRDPDLFIGEGVVPNPPYPGLYYFENVGTPQVADFVEITNNLIPGTYHVAIRPFLVDIDEDHDNDIFLCDNNGNFFFAENIGSPVHPSFLSPVMNWQGIDFFGGTSFCFYDLDNDNDFDLFFFVGTDYNRHVVMYHNIGTPQNPSFSLQPDTIITNLDYIGYFDGIDINDIDDDGDGDFLLGTGSNGGILFFRNTTGDTSAVSPPLIQHPLHGIEMTFGPNPANPITWVSFNLPNPQKAELAVYNLLGQKVATLASGYQIPGQHTFFWNAAKQSSGTYFIRLETDLTEAVQTKRVVVLR